MTSVHDPGAVAPATPSAPDPAARLGRLMDGYITTQLLHVATRLGVPDAFAGGPRTGAELARAVGADPGRLTRVLRGLALEDVVEELGDGRFALTATGELLRRDAAAPMADLAVIRGTLYHRAAGELLAAVLDPVVTPFERAYGEPFFALLGRDPALGPPSTPPWPAAPSRRRARSSPSSTRRRRGGPSSTSAAAAASCSAPC